MKTCRRFLIPGLLLLGLSSFALALRFESIGPPKSAFQQPHWPDGTAKVIGHQSRVYYSGGTGAESYYYKATAEQVAELIAKYAAMRLREYRIAFLKEQPTVKTFAGDEIDYNVYFFHLEGIGLFMTRRNGGAETFDPTLTIYLDPNEDIAPFRDLAIPDNFIVSSDIEGWPEGKGRKVERELWYGKMQFHDGTSSAMEDGITTTVTFWEKDNPRGINLGQMDNEGSVKGSFSKAELAAFRNGDAWLTLTVGNGMIKALPDHPLLPVENLARDPAEAKPVKVGKPAFYYGRILFEDGSPAILRKRPWPGAEIKVSFAFGGGLCPLERDGTFKVSFTPEQFEQLKARKPDKNIYLPDLKVPNQSTGTFSFPAGKLSLDKDKPGEVRIVNPIPEKGA